PPWRRWRGRTAIRSGSARNCGRSRGPAQRNGCEGRVRNTWSKTPVVEWGGRGASRASASLTLRAFQRRRWTSSARRPALFKEFRAMKNRRRSLLKSLAAMACLPALAVAQPVPQPVRLAMIESLSGAFANTGEAVFRNLLWAVERVNARGGVPTPQGRRLLELARYDGKGQNEEA